MANHKRKLCRHCKRYKHLAEFSISRDGVNLKKTCDVCLGRKKAHYNGEVARLIDPRKDYRVACENCKELHRCQKMMNFGFPLFCEQEIWDVDEYYIGRNLKKFREFTKEEQ